MWLTNRGFSSTIAPPLFSHWLSSTTATPSFPFLLPSPLSSPLSPHCWLLALTSSQPKSSSCPFSHWSSFNNQNFTPWKKLEKKILLQRKLLLKSKGTETTSISVFYLFRCLQLCLNARECEICESVSVHVCFSYSSERKRKSACLQSSGFNTCALFTVPHFTDRRVESSVFITHFWGVAWLSVL